MPKFTEQGIVVPFKEVKHSLLSRQIFWIPQEKIEEYYAHIDDYGYLFVKEPDKRWMVCLEEEQDERMACHEIVTMLELDGSVFQDYYFIVSSIIHELCTEFGEMSQREKIPFYIAVMHRLWSSR